MDKVTITEHLDSRFVISIPPLDLPWTGASDDDHGLTEPADDGVFGG